MSNWLKKMKIKAILLAAAFTAAAAVGVTFAWQTWNLEMTNVLTAHTTEIEINENFDQKTGDKQVRFVNTGTSSVFLRISYTEFWEFGGGMNRPDESKEEDAKQEGENTETPPGNQETNPKYLPTTVLSNTVDGGEIALKYLDDPDNPNRIPSEETADRWKRQWTDGEKWTDGGDGWFYYNKVLKAGGRTEDILTKVLFNEALLEAHPEYRAAHYQLYFKAEVVQCSDGSNTLNSLEVNRDATKKLFGKAATVGADGISVTWE